MTFLSSISGRQKYLGEEVVGPTLLWIDVGTHFGQEYRAIFGPHYSFWQPLIRRWLSGCLLRRGQSLSLSEMVALSRTRRALRAMRGRVLPIFVEASLSVVRAAPVYREADLVINAAVVGGDRGEFKLAKLYLAGGSDQSQSNSVYEKKHGVVKSSYLLTPSVRALEMMDAISSHYKNQHRNLLVYLRLNCEGSEDDVIFAAHSVFGSGLAGVAGSLKDVAEIKGHMAMVSLEHYLISHEINVTDFSSNTLTWPNALRSLLNCLRDHK